MRLNRLFGWMDQPRLPAKPTEQPPELDQEQKFLNSQDAQRSEQGHVPPVGTPPTVH